MNRWHFVFWTILLLGSGWVWLSRPPARAQPFPNEPRPAVGSLAPNFTLTSLTGESITLSQLRGKPVVLNFWATWCQPCQRELPALQATAEDYADMVTILGIDQAEDQAIVQKFVDRFGLTYPILLDAEYHASDLYNVRGMPTTFFVDRDGFIQHLWIGEMNRITLAEGIELIREGFD
jgi:peroxiredoxin